MTAPKNPHICDPLDEELARDVLAYLAEYPGAADTLEGIAEWWLLRQRVRTVVARVDRVLRRLTEHGELEAEGAGPSRRYRLRAGAGGDARPAGSR